MKTLFYIGKPYPHDEAIDRLKRAGYRIGLFHDASLNRPGGDVFDWIVDVDFSSEETFMNNIRDQTNLPTIDGILCPYENYIIYRAIAALQLNVASLSVAAARACTDKLLMRSKFMHYDAAITPPFSPVSSKQELINFAKVHKFPLVLKPTNLVKSLLVSKCYSLEELLSNYDAAIDLIEPLYKKYHITNRKAGMIVEEFMEGNLCSVAAFVDASGHPHFCEGITELKSAQDIGHDDTYLFSRKLPTDIDALTKDRIFRAASQGVRALEMTSTPAHIEIIYDNSQARLVEIGARVGGYRPRMYALSYDLDLLEQEALIATGLKPKTATSLIQYSAFYEFFPFQESLFEQLKNAQNPDMYAYFHLIAKSGDIIGKSKNGFRAAAIIGIAANDRNQFQKQCADVENITLGVR